MSNQNYLKLYLCEDSAENKILILPYTPPRKPQLDKSYQRLTQFTSLNGAF